MSRPASRPTRGVARLLLPIAVALTCGGALQGCERAPPVPVLTYDKPPPPSGTIVVQ